MYIFWLQHFIDNPVEDVEDEESERKDSPGDGVNPLGSVHIEFPHGFSLP